MQQLIVLADSKGIVDMTPQAICGITSIPLDIIQDGLEFLALPDPDSRTEGDDGVRIKLLDDHRAWGWYLVNFEKYKNMRSLEDRREYMKNYMAEQRAKEKKQPAKKAKDFPPTVNQVQEYLNEKGITEFNGEKFVAHYASANWMRGKTKITDWKKCVATWMRDKPSRANPRQGCI